MKLKFKKKIVNKNHTDFTKERSQRQFSVIMLEHNYISVKVSTGSLKPTRETEIMQDITLCLKDTIKFLYLFKFRSHRPVPKIKKRLMPVV